MIIAACVVTFCQSIDPGSHSCFSVILISRLAIQRPLLEMKNVAGTMRESIKKRTRGRPAQSDLVGSDSILRNARKTFGNRGFEATSVREIARDSGVDPALVAHHFGTKDRLWIAVVEQIAQQMAATIDATSQLRSSMLNPQERVAQAIILFIDQVFEEPDIGMFFSTAATEEDERLNTLIDKLVRPYYDVLNPLFVEAKRQNAMCFNDPTLLLFMLLNAISETVSHSHLLARFSPLPKHPKRFKQAVIDTALRMIGLSA